MKCLAYFIFLVVSISNAQNIDTDRPESLLPLLNEFRNECRKRDLHTADAAIAKHLGAIEIVSPEVMVKLQKNREKNSLIPIGLMRKKQVRGLYGYNFVQPVMYLQDTLFEYPHGLRAVVFHELGHFLGLEHSDGLMSKNIDFKKVYTDNEWDLLMDDLVDKLKALPQDSHWIKSDNTYY